MNWRRFVQDYLKFGKRERIGVLLVLAIISLTYLIPRLFAESDSVSLQTDATLLSNIDTLNKKQVAQYEKNYEGEQVAYQPEPSVRNSFSKGELFLFDPNTLSQDGWKKLGLNDHTIKTIINYRNKGGRFYKSEDLKKIWGLPEGFYDYVAEYISINEQQQKAEKFVFTKEQTKTWDIDLNTADTSALIALPGIGSKLALRIINFRDKLGGFYSIEQLGETYGLSDSTFKKIKPFLHVSGEVEKLNINSCTKDNLKNHPYIKWELANAIVEYRNQHGSFKQLQDLKNITLLNEPTFNKIAPYLSL